MSKKNTGGPAFPTENAHQTGTSTWHEEGMTLRDYFAAIASEEDINAHIWKGHDEDFVMTDGYGAKTVVKRQAMWSREEAKFLYADAMLKARDA